MEHIVIIGNGIAGITAARHIRKQSDKKITVISSESDHFFSRTALMYVYMGHMKFDHLKPYEDWFWKKNRIALINGLVVRVDISNNTIHLQDSQEVPYDKLIIATGSKTSKYGWPGQDLLGVQGLYSKQDLETMEALAPNKEICTRAVIVGGGLIGIEMAEMLRSRDIPVTFLVREDSYWSNVLPLGESQMINEHILEHHIDLRLSTNLVSIIPDEFGRVKAVTTDNGETIACNFVGLAPGVTPNIDFLKDSGITLGKGVKVNQFLETNIPNIYAIGDCAEQHQAIGNRRAIEAVWYTGRMMGEVVAQTVCGNKMPYNPGHWFNSAKFLDIEYQTYGWVHGNKGKPAEETHFHWRHEKEKICITMAFHKDSKQFLGINTFGIRMRHDVIDRWLTEKRAIDHVLIHLKDANFDPEFYKSYEAAIISSYNKEYNTSLRPKKKSWKRIFSNA
ncbi:NAD(P)/FAD-dependent oxidoreductase [Arenibacter sp. 6A1]|uniref:NAD(P)/FAD-dependent oxidoreductase n=1 Tax=Arenibacter sp. 6A1 TaxID=2720391 RepID=UPI001446A6FA|nr:FAD/NAD(P)-binding oxidoreductase [Arenibacter sp. 6A1]NKI26084.1 NAD(P)/FAD-dependent oxidoreductase [Arenibacter sp. 6A1]